jgi:hypothetical protein
MLSGEAALDALGIELTADSLPYFLFGCQGPDIFYHNQRTKPSGLHYGSLAHRKRFGSLVAAAASSLEPENRRPERPEGAYILGLSTHAALDRATHPFIVCRSFWIGSEGPTTRDRLGCHAFLERLLDRELLALREGLKPAGYGITAKLGLDRTPAPETDARLIALWEAGLRAAYAKASFSDELLVQRIANALADGRHFYRATDPATARAEDAPAEWRARLEGEEGRYLVSILYPELPHAQLDAMNMAKASWPHPSGDGRVSNASYPELVAQGERKAAEAVAAAMDFWAGASTEDELASVIGDGGLSLVDAEGVSQSPQASSPLALPQAMDAELAARIGRAH